MAEFADLLEGKCGGAQVGLMRAYDGAGIRSAELRNAPAQTQGGAHTAIRQRGEDVVGDTAVGGKPLQRSQHGVMLHIRDQHVIALLENTLEQKVQGVGGVERKDDTQRVVRVKMATDRLSAIVDPPCRGECQGMGAAPGVSAIPLDASDRCLVNATGLWKAGSGIVKIDESQV